MKSLLPRLPLSAAVPLVTAVLTFAFLWPGRPVTGQGSEEHSLVDYLRGRGRDASLAGRGKLFGARYPGERYRGSAQQNARLLAALLEQDREAQAAADAAARRLADFRGRDRAVGARAVEQSFRFLRWAPAQGFGVLGSYVVTVHASVRGNAIADRHFVVALDTAAARLGRLTVTGTVEILVGTAAAPVQRFDLKPAWFDTVGPAHATTHYLYAPRGTVVQVPAGRRVQARVILQPVVSTPGGSVPLGPGTAVVTLDK
jgi:hypothetical protein